MVSTNEAEMHVKRRRLRDVENEVMFSETGTDYEIELLECLRP